MICSSSKRAPFQTKWGHLLSDYDSIKRYRLRPPPPARAPPERLAPEEGRVPIVLPPDDLLDVLGDVDLFDVLGEVDFLDVLGDFDLLYVLGDFDLLDFDGLFEALLDVDALFEERPACEVEGRDPF